MILIKRKAKIIIISHLGRPKGKKNELTLTPVYKFLKENLIQMFIFLWEI